MTSLTDENEESSPFGGPTIVITTIYHVASLVSSYTNFNALGQPGVVGSTAGPRAFYTIGMFASGTLAAWGGWCLMFAGDGSGGEGRGKVSGWPFRNEEERRRKREKMMARKMGKKGE